MLDRPDTIAPPKKKKRWLRRFFVSFVILLIAVIITVQIVLSSSYPKTLVIAQVERALGLNVQAKSFSTGWWGHTTLHDVTISLPLADQAFLTIPELRVEHSSLPMMALKRGITLDSIRAERPQLVIRQDPTGRWDLQQALELMKRTSGAKNTEEQKQPTLPALTITDGTIHVIDNQGREAMIEPVDFHGEPQNSLAWRFEAKVNDELTLDGAVNPGRVWEHNVNFSLAKIDPWLKPWVRDLPKPLAVEGKWEGRLRDGALSGQARLASAVVSNFKSSGVVNVMRDDVGVHLRPDGLLVESPTKLAPEVRVSSGEILLQANQVAAKALRLTAAGGDVQVDGQYSWANVAGQIEARWSELALPTGVVHGGNAKASLRTPLPNRPEIAAEVHSRGNSEAGRWTADVNLTGKGESWNKIDWIINAPLLDFATAKRHFVVHSVGARLATADDTLRLLEVTHEGPEVLRATGELNLSNKNWTVDLAAGSVQFPTSQPVGVDLAVQASGNAVGSIDLQRAHLRRADLIIEARGNYDAHRPKPVALSLNISQNPTIGEEEANPLVKGHVESEATVAGTLAPMDIGISGKLEAERLSVREHLLGDATLQFNGQVTANGAIVKTTELNAFGGKWNINATWAGADEPFNIHADVRDLPVEQLADVIKQNEISGKLAGEWDIVTSSLRPSKMKLTGQFKINDPSVGPIAADRITSKVAMEHGIVRLSELEAHKEQGRVHASAQFPLLHPAQWHFEGSMSDWPYALPRDGSSLRLSAQTALDADFLSRAATGTLDLSSDIILNRELAGVAKLNASASGDTVQISNITANLIGGTLSGSGAYHFNDPLKSNVLLHLQNVDASRVAGIWPAVSDISGTYNVLFVAAPATNPRALGPLRLSLTVHPTNGKFRTLPVGNIDVVAFADRQDGLSRLVIDDSTINVADGEVRVWGRRSQHAGATTNEARPVSSQLEIQLSQLDLNQIIHAFKPDEKPTPGRVSGSFVFAGTITNREQLFGSGTMRLTDADVGNVEPFSTIYNFLNLRFGQRAPAGRGYAELRLQGDLLQIDNAFYRIGGADVRMSGDIRDIWKAPQSPIRGRAIASAQPFAEWKIPIIKETGDFFAALTSGTVGAFEIGGTLAHRKTTPAAVADTANIFRQLLGMHPREDQ
jgi:hypothetical protein